MYSDNDDIVEKMPVSLPKGPYEPSWSSLKKYRVPKWFADAKLGIFIHWGVYSVPAFGNEWYPRHMYMPGRPEYEYHVKNFGTPDKFGYKDFIPMFTAENWDPDEWVRLFERAGARYVVLVAEHHDGFALWNTSYSRWNSVLMGPKRDIVGELAEAVRRRGLVFGVSYHRAEHWWFFEPGTRIDSDVKDPRYWDLYGPAKKASLNPRDPPGPENVHPDKEFLDDWLLRAVELVEKYRPQLFYFDWWIENPAFEPYLRFFAAYYYNRAEKWDLGVVIAYKNRAFQEGTAVLDVERGRLGDIHPYPWQTDTSVDYLSWGYVKNAKYKTPDVVVRDLVDIVSKNGNLLLNVGPKPDGEIPEEAKKILLSLGEWLSINGEAIYSSKPWRVYGEGPTKSLSGQFIEDKEPPYTPRDIRFTVKDVYPYGEVLYAITMAMPKEGDEIAIRSLGAHMRLGREIDFVEVLGSKEVAEWRVEPDGLKVKIPKTSSKHCVAIKIVFKKQ